jgi:hypothetical protein
LAAGLLNARRGRRLLLPREEVFYEPELVKPQPEAEAPAEPEFKLGGGQLPRQTGIAGARVASCSAPWRRMISTSRVLTARRGGPGPDARSSSTPA